MSSQTVWNQIRADKTLALIGSKLFDLLMVFLKEFLEKVDVKKKQTTKKLEKFLWGKE